MKKIFSLILVFTLFTSFGTAHADQVVNADTLKNFLASMTEVKTIAEQMDEAGKDKIMQNSIAEVNGDFAPYTQAAQNLKTKYPQDYQKLENVIYGHGFSSVKEWALTGDDLIVAYMTTKVTPEAKSAMEGMQNMSPDMMSMMPPQAKAAMKKGKAMLKAMKDVPPENIKLVNAHADEIEQVMNEMKE